MVIHVFPPFRAHTNTRKGGRQGTIYAEPSKKNGGPLSPPKKKTYCKSHVKYCQIIASDCCFHFSS